MSTTETGKVPRSIDGAAEQKLSYKSPDTERPTQTPRLAFLAFVGIGLWGSLATGRADIIIGPTSSGTGLNSALYGPVGQSFTADVSDITSVGMFTSICGCAGDGYTPIEFQMSLLDGAGVNGPVVASETAVGAWGLYGFVFFNFTGTDLTVGDTYTAVFSQITPDPAPMGDGGALVYGSNSNVYSGGEAFWGSPYSIGPDQPQPNSDFFLQVLSTPQDPVPEPGTYAILTAGLVGFLIAKRRKMSR